MNLRKKLLTTLGGLALLAIVNAGVTTWATFKWEASNARLRDHYQRSLLLQRIRANTFRAFKEVGDAIVMEDDDAPLEFEESLKPVEQDFQHWANLAHTDAEKQQVQQIRSSYEQLVRDAQTFFNLIDSGRTNEALIFMEEQLENENFQSFEDLTEAAVASDQNYRQIVKAQVQNTRQTAQIVLLLVCFGLISLIFLFAAYLSADLLTPLREIKEALLDVSRGDLQRRLNEERKDEIGKIDLAFNKMVEAIQKREQMMQLAAVPTGSSNEEKTDGSDWQQLPSRLMLHQLVSQLRSRVTRLEQQEATVSSVPSDNGAVPVTPKQELIEDLDGLLQTISRLTQFGFPLDLNLARTDIKALLYEVLLRFHEEFLHRGVSFELDIATDVREAIVDRLKLREAIGELVLNALDALPEQGGHLGIRASIADRNQELLIEVADNGRGIERFSIDQAFSSFELKQKRPRVGLKLTRAIIEQHGGRLLVDTNPGEGTYVQMRLPLRE